MFPHLIRILIRETIKIFFEVVLSSSELILLSILSSSATTTTTATAKTTASSLSLPTQPIILRTNISWNFSSSYSKKTRKYFGYLWNLGKIFRKSTEGPSTTTATETTTTSTTNSTSDCYWCDMNYFGLLNSSSTLSFNYKKSSKQLPELVISGKSVHQQQKQFEQEKDFKKSKENQKLIRKISKIKTNQKIIPSTTSSFTSMGISNPISDSISGGTVVVISGSNSVSSNSSRNSSNSSYEDITNGCACADYTDFNVSFTPSMSQVLLAPTSSSGISSSSSTSSSAASSVSQSDGTTNPSGNGTDDGINSFYFYETEQFAVLWVLFTVIVLGNSAVLVTLFMSKNRKSRMNFFIKQLAIADLLVGLLNVLTDIIWRITVSWRAGNLACKMIRFLQVCVTYASTYVLVALSIDRYDAITHPMNFSGSWRRARRLVVSAWTISAIFSAPMLYLYEERLIQGQTQCWIDLGEPWKWQIYMSLVAATLFAIPALIISACYAIIVRTIWVKGAVFIPAERTRAGGCINPASRRASSRGIIPRAKVKTVKMTFVIVIVFVVCWSPYIVFDLLQVFGQIPRTQTNIAIATFIQSLAPLNSAANPLIYCLFSTQVCRALKRVPPFRWILSPCCCKTNGQNLTPIRCTNVGQRLHNSCDSMRTLTTSLTVSRRSTNCMRPARVVIVERPKTILAMSEV